MDLWRGKVAVVTGASDGIGEGVARKLAAEGMKVVAVARRKELLDALEADINSKHPGHCFTQVCDVTDEVQVKRTFDWVKEKFGFASVLVNNAGVSKEIKLMDLNLDNAKAIVNTNLLGVLSCTKEWLDSIKGADADGHLINMNSFLGHEDMGIPDYSVYTGVKHALTIITRALHTELDKAKSKIRITSMCPGLVKSGMSREAIDKFGIPHILPEDIADSIIYVLSAPLNVNVSDITVEPIHGRNNYSKQE